MSLLVLQVCDGQIGKNSSNVQATATALKPRQSVLTARRNMFSAKQFQDLNHCFGDKHVKKAVLVDHKATVWLVCNLSKMFGP